MRPYLHAIPYREGAPDDDEQPARQVRQRILERDREAGGRKTQVGGDPGHSVGLDLEERQDTGDPERIREHLVDEVARRSLGHGAREHPPRYSAECKDERDR